MARSGLGHRLYAGEVSYDFIGKRRRFYLVSLAVLLISLASLGVKGLHLGIEFKGGASFQLSSNGRSVDQIRSVVDKTVGGESIVQTVGQGQVRVQTEPLSERQTTQVRNALASEASVSRSTVTINTVGSSWGSDVSKKALQGLIVFLILTIVFLSVFFEPKMAAAAIIALIHDLLITAGIYSLVGFEVTPSTVIALLTILGYSLYDTVVVFDKVRENTAGIAGTNRMTYSGATNLAVNQTLIRSINTSVIALLPVAALLFIGAGLLGAGTLKDLSLALFIGLASGAYSSIFIASPLLCDLKEREPQMKALARRVQARQSGDVGAGDVRSRRSSSRGSARVGGTPGGAETGGPTTGTAVLDREPARPRRNGARTPGTGTTRRAAAGSARSGVADAPSGVADGAGTIEPGPDRSGGTGMGSRLLGVPGSPAAPAPDDLTPDHLNPDGLTPDGLSPGYLPADDLTPGGGDLASDPIGGAAPTDADPTPNDGIRRRQPRTAPGRSGSRRTGGRPSGKRKK